MTRENKRKQAEKFNPIITDASKHRDNKSEEALARFRRPSWYQLKEQKNE